MNQINVKSLLFFSYLFYFFLPSLFHEDENERFFIMFSIFQWNFCGLHATLFGEVTADFFIFQCCLWGRNGILMGGLASSSLEIGLVLTKLGLCNVSLSHVFSSSLGDIRPLEAGDSQDNNLNKLYFDSHNCRNTCMIFWKTIAMIWCRTKMIASQGKIDAVLFSMRCFGRRKLSSRKDRFVSRFQWQAKMIVFKRKDPRCVVFNATFWWAKIILSQVKIALLFSISFM